MTDYQDDQDQYDDEPYDYSDDPNVQQVTDEPRPRPVPDPAPRRETVIPIGEAVTPETMHGVVAFTRSLNLGSRDNNAHFRCEMPFVVQPQWAPDQVAAQAADTFYQCVAVVLQQAGLPFTVGEDGVLHEVVQAFPGTRRVDQDTGQDRGPRREPQYDQGNSRGGGGQFPHPADMRRPEHIRTEDWRDLCANYEDWYDNRQEKADGSGYPNGPDFKRKDDGKGLWLTPFRKDGGRGGRQHQGGGQRQYRG